jgi:methyl-accepting chemotaxis protein
MGEKYKRKKFFINKRLQIRYMISLLIPMLILIVFIGLVMYYSQYKFLQATTKEMSKELKNVLITNQMYIEDEAERNKKSVMEIKERLGRYMSGEGAFSKSLLQTAYKILFMGLFVVIVELAFLTIFISHKVAGPVYRLEKFAEDFRNGDFTSRIYLRQGDELLDVASDFNKTGDFIRDRVKQLADLSAQMLEAAKAAGAPPDKVTLLEKAFNDFKANIRLE